MKGKILRNICLQQARKSLKGLSCEFDLVKVDLLDKAKLG
jgi:hypothetical protein